MVALTKATFKAAIFMAKALTSGKMAENTPETTSEI